MVVGINKFRMDEEEARDVELHANDPETEKRQIERVRRVREERDARGVKEALARLLVRLHER